MYVEALRYDADRLARVFCPAMALRSIASLAEYESLKETAYLMATPANGRRLLDAIDRLENRAGAGTF